MAVLLNAKQAAAIIDCSPDDMYIYQRKGWIKGIQVGTSLRYWRWRRADVCHLAKKLSKLLDNTDTAR